MNGLTSFKNEIYKAGVLAAVLIEMASLPFLGLNARFGYGLALGTAISIVNFNIMEFALRRTLSGGGGVAAFRGYMVRLLIYGGAFYMSMRVGIVSGLATLLGFLTLKAAVYYLYGFKAKFSEGRKVRPEVKAAYGKLDAMKKKRKTDRILDKIRNELGYREDARTYRRKKLRKR